MSVSSTSERRSAVPTPSGDSGLGGRVGRAYRAAEPPVDRDYRSIRPNIKAEQTAKRGRRFGQWSDMEDLMTTINRALRARGCSARQASLEAGSPELIRNLRRGRMPSVERLQVLCEVLELEFYIGPAREAGAIDERRLREAVASTERTLGARGIALEPDAKADAVAAIYDLLDRERSPATAARVEQLIEALGRPASHEYATEPQARDLTG